MTNDDIYHAGHMISHLTHSLLHFLYLWHDNDQLAIGNRQVTIDY